MNVGVRCTASRIAPAARRTSSGVTLGFRHRAIVDERARTADRRNRHTRPVTEVAEAGDTPRRLPIQIVVADDLERSRVTVFFRLLLAIPHLIVVAFWGLAAFAVSVIIWLALLFEGKAPRSLQRFVVSYLRYSVHVSAYLYLAAGPYPPFGGGEGYPIDLEIEPSGRQSRGGVAARLVLAIPALLLAAAVGGGSWFVNTSWATSQDTGRRLVDGLVGRRARRNGRPARVVRVARAGSYAPRAARPDRLRDRLHGAGRRLRASRHRPLSDLRPGADRARHRPAPASGATRAHRPPRAVAAHRLLPAPADDPAPDLAPPLVRARRAGRCSSPGSSRS